MHLPSKNGIDAQQPYLPLRDRVEEDSLEISAPYIPQWQGPVGPPYLYVQHLCLQNFLLSLSFYQGLHGCASDCGNVRAW